MHEDEFKAGIDEQIRNVSESINVSDGRRGITVRFPHIRPTDGKGFFEIQPSTVSNKTQTALRELNAARDAIVEAAMINKELETAYLRSPEGIAAAKRDVERKIWQEKQKRAIALAEETGRLVDEHGGFSTRGDHFSINVKDVVDDPLKLRGFHASGNMLAVVGQSRRRVYAGHHWSPSVCEDMFLIGKNENGVAFAHAIPAQIETVHSAVSWIWDVDNIEDVIDRHGDVAVIKTKMTFKSGIVGKIAVLDSHVFEGEYKKNGAIYVRNGVLHHEKNQHPDVKIGNEWVRLKAARRSERKVSIGSSD